MRVVSWGLVQKGWVCFLTLHDCICVTWGSPFYGLYLIYFPFLIQWCTTLLFFHQGPCPNFITSRSNEITKRSSSKVPQSSSKVPQSQKEGNKERSEKRKYQLKILERHRLEGGTATLSEAHLRLKNKTTSNSHRLRCHAESLSWRGKGPARAYWRKTNPVSLGGASLGWKNKAVFFKASAPISSSILSSGLCRPAQYVIKKQINKWPR